MLQAINVLFILCALTWARSSNTACYFLIRCTLATRSLTRRMGSSKRQVSQSARPGRWNDDSSKTDHAQLWTALLASPRRRSTVARVLGFHHTRLSLSPASSAMAQATASLNRDTPPGLTASTHTAVPARQGWQNKVQGSATHLPTWTCAVIEGSRGSPYNSL